MNLIILTEISRPIANEMVCKVAFTKREKPITTKPSKISIKPLIKTTPGTRYNTLVATATLAVCSSINAPKLAIIEATDAVKSMVK